MFRIILLSALVTCFASCKKDEKKEAAPTPPETTPAETEPAEAAEPAADLLVIKAAKLSFEKKENNPDGPDSLSLDDSGTIMAGDKPVAELSADGKVVDMSGKLLATMAADGTLSFEGESETVLIAEDGSITKDGKTIASISEDGTFSMAELSEKVVYEGPPETRRAIMVVFLTAMMPMQQAEESEVAPSAEVKAEPVPEPVKK